MKQYLSMGVVALAFGSFACNEAAKPTQKAGSTTATIKEVESEHHDHGAGPNGGVIFDLGKYHAEFTVNHDEKSCQIFMVELADSKTPLPVSAKNLTLTTKETKTKEGKVVPPMTIDLKPIDEKDGKATKFVGKNDGLGNVAEFAGTVLGEIEAKPVKGSFEE